MQHPNVERITSEYRAFATGDYSALGELFAADAVWHVRGAHAHDVQGREAIVDFLRRLSHDAHGDFMIEVHDVLADDEHTVVLAHTTVHRDGETYTADEVHVFHTDDAGLITEAWGFTSDPAGQGAFLF